MKINIFSVKPSDALVVILLTFFFKVLSYFSNYCVLSWCGLCGGNFAKFKEVRQVRIQDLVKGGAPASEAESCRCSEAESRERSEHSAAGVQGPLKGPGSFWVFDAQICIFTHSRDSFLLFLTSILTPKVDRKRALDFTSINLRHSDMLHLFFNLHEKVML